MSATGMSGATGKGPYRHQSANWKASLAVGYGDAVYGDTGDLDSAGNPFDKTASQGTFGAGTHSQAQVAFKALFRGYADTRRTTLQTTAGTQATDGGILATGEFRKPCAALGSAAKPGDLVGPAQGSGGGQTLDPQKVEIVATTANAIGVVTQFAAVGATALVFEIHAATFDRGVQAVV